MGNQDETASQDVEVPQDHLVEQVTMVVMASRVEMVTTDSQEGMA